MGRMGVMRSMGMLLRYREIMILIFPIIPISSMRSPGSLATLDEEMGRMGVMRSMGMLLRCREIMIPILPIIPISSIHKNAFHFLP